MGMIGSVLHKFFERISGWIAWPRGSWRYAGYRWLPGLLIAGIGVALEGQENSGLDSVKVADDTGSVSSETTGFSSSVEVAAAGSEAESMQLKVPSGIPEDADQASPAAASDSRIIRPKVPAGNLPESGSSRENLAPGIAVWFVYGVLLVAAAFLFWRQYRRGPAALGLASGSGTIHLLETKNLGSKQFLVLAEVEERRLLIGIGPGFIRTLSEWPLPPAQPSPHFHPSGESFSSSRKGADLSS